MKEDIPIASTEKRNLKQMITSPTGLGIASLVALGGYLVWDSYPAQVAVNLSLILILGVCFGMHFFMHGSHGSKYNKSDDKMDGGDQ